MYLGNSPSLARKQLFLYIPTDGQTVITGIDSRGNILTYTPGLENVYKNGSLLLPTDYTTNTTGTSITLDASLVSSDEIIIDAFGAFSLADTYRKSETFERAQNFADVLNASTARINLGLNNEVGMVGAFAMNTAPTGWLKANGAAISRTTYSALFAKIGTTHGVGNGSTTFNLPDMRGEFLRGWDDARGIDSGRVFASAQAAEFASHTHTVTDPTHAHAAQFWGWNTPANAVITSGANNFAITSLSFTSSASTGITNQSTGGTETRPRNIALLFCIKYQE
jgi:microcystin-dependent protein